jgi:hypothetical protein
MDCIAVILPSEIKSFKIPKCFFEKIKKAAKFT